MKNIYKVITVISCLLMLSSCASNKNDPKIVIAIPDAGLKPIAASNSERNNVRLELAKNYLRVKQFDLASKELDEVLKNDESADALHLKAIALMGGQNYKDADVYFQKSIAKNNNPDILNNYGWFLCKQKDIKGLEYLNKAEPLADANLYPKLLATKGVCALYAKNYPLALKLLQRSLELNPNYVPASVYTAFIYAKQNNTIGAESILHSIGVGNINEPELLWLGVNVFKISGNTISARLWGDVLVSEYPTTIEAMKHHRNMLEN
jgi:type IV pilus assembly protein PilF